MKPVDFIPFGFLFLEKVDSSLYSEAVIDNDTPRDSYNPRTQMSEPIRYYQFLTWKKGRSNEADITYKDYLEYLSWATSMSLEFTYTYPSLFGEQPDDAENTDEWLL